MPEIMAEMFTDMTAAEKVDFFIRIGGKGILHYRSLSPDGVTLDAKMPLDSILLEAL